MSERGLIKIVVVQLLLLVGIAFLLVDRLGRLRPIKPGSWTFRNPTLDVAKGTRVMLQPQTGMRQATRWFISDPVVEPDVNGAPGVPHRPTLREDWEGGGFTLFTGRSPRSALILTQMGAMTDSEWFEELRPVMETGPEGRTTLRLVAVYGHTNGSAIVYVHDPENPTPGFGWSRIEIRAPEKNAQVHFARDVTTTAPR